jgi:flagellar M-ring protein FliF
MNYETSRTVRRIKLPQGIIRRMSVSVLIDHKVRWEAGKGKGAAPQKIVEPVPPEEIKIIHDVVAAAAGFNGTRGDQLTVDSLPFQATIHAQPPDWMKPAAPAAPKTIVPLWKQPAVLIGGGVGLLILLAAGFLIVSSRRKSRAAVAELQKKLEAAQAPPPPTEEVPSLEAATHPAAIPSVSDKLFNLAEAREAFRLPPLSTTKTEILTRQVIEEARKDPSALAQIIRSWLNEGIKQPSRPS